jgi:hypothetical protein
LGGGLAEDEDGFGFELVEMAKDVVGHFGVKAECDVRSSELRKSCEAQTGMAGATRRQMLKC